jgi:FMN phosphatase YigB (HAD superfamily)
VDGELILDQTEEIGEPELIDERIHRYHVLKEKYGSYGAIKEGHRDEILSYVFDNNTEAMEIFGKKEQEHLKAAPGAEEALQYLQEQTIERAVVAELKKTLGPIGTDIVTRFLKSKGLLHYFDELISPQGSITLRDGSVDLKYKGKTKEESLYDELAKDAEARHQASEAVMIGDKLWTDISPAKKRGLKRSNILAISIMVPHQMPILLYRTSVN